MSIKKVSGVFKVLSLDVGGTLMDYSYFDHVWNIAIPELYADKKGLGLEEAQKEVFREYDLVGSGDLRWYLPEYWFNRFQLDEDPRSILVSQTDKIRFYPEVSGVLGRLSQGYTLVTASVIPRDQQDIILGDFRRCFTHLFSSITDLGEVRKKPGFYRMICRTLRIEPHSLIHVGDEWPSDFIAPRTLGITSYIVDRRADDRRVSVLRDLNELEECLGREEGKRSS